MGKRTTLGCVWRGFALAQSGLVKNGLVGTDLEEDTNRLEIAVKGEEFRAKAEAAVEKAGIPLEVVRITVREPFRTLQAQTLHSRIRPLAGGLQIEADDELFALRVSMPSDQV